MLRFLGRLFRNEEGSNLAYTAFIAIPLIGAVGVGTDAGRGYMVRSKLSQALDAAALAGAQKKDDADEMEADIRQFFKVNFPDNYLESTITGPTFSWNDDDQSVTVTASARVPTSFMRIFGIEYMNVSASTEVTRQTNYMDVVLSIDMSGSMGWSAPGGGTRIAAARTAAKTLIDELFGSLNTSELLKIGVVPWNAKVNVTVNGTPYNPGNNNSETVTSFINPLTGASQNVVYKANHSPVPLLSQPPNNWKGCVYARFKDNGVNDDGDTVDGDVEHVNGDWVAWEPVGAEGEPQNPGKCSAVPWWSWSECTPCLNRGIYPLASDKNSIKAYINSLTQPEGSTNIAQGLMWAWRVLSPEAPFTEADPDPDGPRTQAIVLLTDGEHVREYGDAYKRQLQNWELDQRLREIAANIKARGIIIYTIQFANGGGAQQQLMKDIASEPNAPYYYFAPTTQELQNVFKAISQHLSKLRISK